MPCPAPARSGPRPALARASPSPVHWDQWTSRARAVPSAGLPSFGDSSDVPTARPWKGAGPLVVAGLLLTLTGSHALADDTPPAVRPVAGLGRQARSRATRPGGDVLPQGPPVRSPERRGPPGLDDLDLTRVALQEPAEAPPARPARRAAAAAEADRPPPSRPEPRSKPPSSSSRSASSSSPPPSASGSSAPATCSTLTGRRRHRPAPPGPQRLRIAEDVPQAVRVSSSGKSRSRFSPPSVVRNTWRWNWSRPSASRPPPPSAAGPWPT